MDQEDASSKGRAGSSGPGSAQSPTPPGPFERSNSQSSLHKASHIASHRQSFAENQRHPPPSPRSQRHPSFTQQAIQDLLNHPPTNRHPNPRFAGRDWRDVALGELASPEDVKWVQMDTSVEEATMVLLRSCPSNIVLIRDSPSHKAAVSAFDYGDLNAYLLVVVGLAQPEDGDAALYCEIAKKAQAQEAIALREIQPLRRTEGLVALSAESKLDRAVEILGSGVHQVLVVNQASEVVGLISQLRLVEFFWNESINFPAVDRLYGALLRDLQIGSHQIIAIKYFCPGCDLDVRLQTLQITRANYPTLLNSVDAPLADALTLMFEEGLTSVAVVDNGLNVVGNISTADVKHLTSAASLPLLKSTSMHFLSVILSERGMEKGRDSFPVFHVNPHSTLAHTVAKLVATQSHRMWIVEAPSPSPSAPATPLLAPSLPQQPSSTAGTTSAAALPAGSEAASPRNSSTVVMPGIGSSSAPPPSPLPTQGFSSVPAAAYPGARLSGRLTGVVSLTDILNLFAKSTGLHPADPSEQRARRRRSSSSSVRPSIDSARASIDFRR